MVVLIGLIGRKQSGKDTFADYLVRHHGFVKYAFADPVKKICEIMFLLDAKQMTDPVLKETLDGRWGATPRQMMQRVGTDMVRQIWGEDFWIENMDMRIQGGHERIVVSDVRFPNEAGWIKKKGGVLVRIEDGKPHPDTHPSETLQASIIEDILVLNHKDGIDRYHQQIQETLSTLGLF